MHDPIRGKEWGQEEGKRRERETQRGKRGNNSTKVMQYPKITATHERQRARVSLKKVRSDSERCPQHTKTERILMYLNILSEMYTTWGKFENELERSA